MLIPHSNVSFDYRINEDGTVQLFFIKPDKHIEINLTDEELQRLADIVRLILNKPTITYGGHASGMTHGEG